MDDPRNVKHFGYRAPRLSFPETLHIEIMRAGTSDIIAVRGIDISANGIAIAVDNKLPVDEPLELAIRAGDVEAARIPGRVFYQTEERYGLAFEYSSEEQCQQVRDLISQFVKTV